MRQGGTIAPLRRVTPLEAPPFDDQPPGEIWCQSALYALLAPVPICGSVKAGNPLPVLRLTSHAILQIAFGICKAPSDCYFIPLLHAVRCLTSSPVFPFRATRFHFPHSVSRPWLHLLSAVSHLLFPTQLHHKSDPYEFECSVGPCCRLLFIVLLLNVVMGRPPETAPPLCPLCILVPMSLMLPRPSYLASANHSSQIVHPFQYTDFCLLILVSRFSSGPSEAH